MKVFIGGYEVSLAARIAHDRQLARNAAEESDRRESERRIAREVVRLLEKKAAT